VLLPDERRSYAPWSTDSTNGFESRDARAVTHHEPGSLPAPSPGDTGPHYLAGCRRFEQYADCRSTEAFLTHGGEVASALPAPGVGRFVR